MKPCHSCRKKRGQAEREITSPMWRALPSHLVSFRLRPCRELVHPRRKFLRASLALTLRLCFVSSGLTRGDEELVCPPPSPVATRSNSTISLHLLHVKHTSNSATICIAGRSETCGGSDDSLLGDEASRRALGFWCRCRLSLSIRNLFGNLYLLTRLNPLRPVSKIPIFLHRLVCLVASLVSVARDERPQRIQHWRYIQTRQVSSTRRTACCCCFAPGNTHEYGDPRPKVSRVTEARSYSTGEVIAILNTEDNLSLAYMVDQSILRLVLVL